MNRKALALLAIALICLPLCASVTGGVDGLMTASTEHFDIIYQQGSAETASLIYNSCENVYGFLVSFFGRDPQLHIPVVVTREFKALNAYYTCFPANRIVIFDTVADVGELSNYPQTILYIFRHELAHAFQFNIRSRFWQGISNVIGDIASVSPFLYLTPSLSEGGAVLAESLDGYGRLNDSYAMQIVKQAKLEGLFPSWIDVAGARDTYPGGMLYYNFAGCFLGYLAQTYGVETVGHLYGDFDHINWFASSSQLFERRFGKGLKELWADFEAWVSVPESVLEPQNVESFKAGGNYSDMVLSGGDLYLFDRSTASAMKTDAGLSSFREILMLPTDKAGLSVSSDGRLMLVPYVTDSISQLRLYDITSRRAKPVHYFDSSERDFRDGCFVRLGDTDYAIVYSNEGQNTFLGLYDLVSYDLADNGFASSEISLGYGVIASDFVDVGGGRVAFLASLNAQDRIAVLDVSTMEIRLLENPEGLSFQSLSLGLRDDAPVICFTCYHSSSRAPSLGFYGELTLGDEAATVRLSEVDILGSPNNAIRLNDRVILLSRLYETRKLCSAEISDLALSEPVCIGFEEMFNTTHLDVSSLVNASVKYHPIRYFTDGLFLPYGYISFGGDDGGALILGYAVGVMYLTMDPTETFTHLLGASYSSEVVKAGYQMTHSGLVPVTVSVDGAYSPKMQASELDVSIEPSFTFELGHKNRRLEISDNLSLSLRSVRSALLSHSLRNILSLKYSSSRSKGMNYYDALGYSVGMLLYNATPTLSFGLEIPRAMPWRCDGRHITNLPMKLTLSTRFDSQAGVFSSADVGLVLYDYEIQKGIQFLGLYMQRFVLGAGYHAGYGFADGSFNHSMSLSAHIYMTPVLGEYLSKLKVGFAAKLWTDFDGGWKADFSFDL